MKKYTATILVPITCTLYEDEDGSLEVGSADLPSLEAIRSVAVSGRCACGLPAAASHLHQDGYKEPVCIDRLAALEAIVDAQRAADEQAWQELKEYLGDAAEATPEELEQIYCEWELDK